MSKSVKLSGKKIQLLGDGFVVLLYSWNDPLLLGRVPKDPLVRISEIMQDDNLTQEEKFKQLEVELPRMFRRQRDMEIALGRIVGTIHHEQDAEKVADKTSKILDDWMDKFQKLLKEEDKTEDKSTDDAGNNNKV